MPASEPVVQEPVVLLIKHSLPEVQPTQPPAQWRLGTEGQQRCLRLAEHLAGYQPGIIYASLEPKAQETARLAAEALGCPWQAVPGLHEHERTPAEYGTSERFLGQVQALFEHPGEIVFGRESADQAHERFSAALLALAETHRSGHGRQPLVVVAHGTVISLFVSRRCSGVEPFPLWQQLGLPSYIVLDSSMRQILQIVPQV